MTFPPSSCTAPSVFTLMHENTIMLWLLLASIFLSVFWLSDHLWGSAMTCSRRSSARTAVLSSKLEAARYSSISLMAGHCFDLSVIQARSPHPVLECFGQVGAPLRPCWIDLHGMARIHYPSPRFIIHDLICSGDMQAPMSACHIV